MTPERYQQIGQLYHAALALEPSQRAAFLEQACSCDEALRREVESLLAANEQGGDFLEAMAAEVAVTMLVDNQPGPLTGQRLGPYQVISQIGQGGMGEVYLAQDSRLGRKVALKLLRGEFTIDQDRLRRFRQEARAISALNHPNILTIHEIGEADGLHYIVTEFIDGQSLRQRLSTTRLRLAEMLDIGIQVASALSAAHQAGIVHRDIKPENIMVRPDGYVKVLDFGLAKLVERQTLAELIEKKTVDTQAPTASRVYTKSGMVMGTVNYMAPEQAEARSIDHRTDIFSLGVVLYELLTGKRPFEGKSAIDTLHAIVNEEPRPAIELNPELPLEVLDILGKALAKPLGERYQHAGDLELDLRRLKRAIETRSLPSAQAKLAVTRHRGLRTTAMRAAIGSLIILGVTGAGWLLGRSSAETTASARLERASPVVSLEKTSVMPVTFDPGFEGEPTFSPDGQTIAYVSDRAGNFEIFLKQVSGGPNINLTNNPADDMQPAFSPDGKQIAFVSSRSGVNDCLCFFIYGTDQPLMGGSIWVMPALGGNPRRIVESGTFPSWSPDGSAIIYSSGTWYGQKVYRVAYTGGDPREIPIQFKDGAPYLAYPSYSPDGRWIAFEANNQIFVVSAEGGEPKQIIKGKHPVWSADSRAIFYTNAEGGKNYTLWQVPFSSTEGKVAGDASPLTVGRGRDTQAVVSRDGKLIAYAALDVSFNIEAAPFDAEAGRQTGAPQPMTSGSDLIYFHDPSRDGLSAVFGSNRGAASSFIWRVDRGSPPVQLTSDPNFDDSGPNWSPDGRTIAFNRKLSKDPKALISLWLMAQDGANPRPLIEKGGLGTWMPDGKALVYLSFDDFQIYLCDLATRNTRRIVGEKGVYGGGVPSPDGKWLAYMSIASGNLDIRAVSIDGGEPRPVITTPRQDFHPIFSPSGRWLYYMLDHKNIYRVPGPAQGWRQAEPQKVTNFPESGLFLEGAQLSRDGRWLLYSRRRTTGDIWVMNLGK